MKRKVRQNYEAGARDHVVVSSFCGEETRNGGFVAFYDEKEEEEVSRLTDEFFPKQPIEPSLSCFFVPTREHHEEDARSRITIERLKETKSVAMKSNVIEYVRCHEHKILLLNESQVSDVSKRIRIVKPSEVFELKQTILVATNHEEWILFGGKERFQSAHDLQKRLLDIYRQTTTGYILISTHTEGMIGRLMRPFWSGSAVLPWEHPFYPGFFTKFTETERKQHAAFFSDTFPGCAAGLGCLYRKEFKDEPDPRMWRMIWFCPGEKVSTIIRAADRIKVFRTIITQRLSRLPQIQSYRLHETYVSNGSSSRVKVFGLALVSLEDAGTIVMQIHQVLQNQVITDYIFPRFIRVFRTTLPNVHDLEHLSDNVTIFAYCGSENRYQQLSPDDMLILAKSFWKPLWSDNCNQWACDELDYEIPFPCRGKKGDQSPRVWFHSTCLHALHDVDPKLEKFSSMVGLLPRFKCPCCSSIMKMAPLNEKGQFRKGSQCAGHYPRNCRTLFSDAVEIINAGNFIALETKPYLNEKETLVARPDYEPSITDLGYQLSK